MSSDLLKEFGDLHENPWNQTPHIADNAAKSIQQNTDIEDDFGDFEAPELADGGDDVPIAATERITLQSAQHGPLVEPNDEEEDFEDETWCKPQESEHDWEWQESTAEKLDRIDHPKKVPGTLLFDAEQHLESALHSDTLPAPTSSISNGKANFQEHDDMDEAFAEWDPVNAPAAPNQIEALVPASPMASVRHETSAPPPRAPDLGTPPTNVPPPSILLSLSIGVLDKIGKDLAKGSNSAINATANTSINNIVSDLTTIGRIIAGRKSRWNRDTLLSQNMRIGQAGSQGGMKLTKVDKSENRREDQEVAELLKTWKQYIGALRSQLTAGRGGKVPDLAANMPVRVGKPSEGALRAPKACFLCGLKRDERVLNVDFAVEDGFGLWWIEHWGHSTCVEFWKHHSNDLRQR